MCEWYATITLLSGEIIGTAIVFTLSIGMETIGGGAPGIHFKMSHSSLDNFKFSGI
jgi:hypothetical protein